MTEINCQHIAFLLYHYNDLYWRDYHALAISHTHTRIERGEERGGERERDADSEQDGDT